MYVKFLQKINDKIKIEFNNNNQFIKELETFSMKYV